jgi:lysophospholipid acyltransferase (LPLAT)-like uncharacterized protein
VKRRFAVWLVPRLIFCAYHLLLVTIRWQNIGEPYRPGQKQRYLYAFWHARMLMMPYTACNDWPGYMLISEHRDGGFIADTMHLLGISTVRGSSTRGGAKAMLRMLRAVKEENRHLCLTPDGPKGPREVVKRGTVQLAKKSGLPFVPVCYATKRHWRINSWDRFYLPQPFTRGVFVFGEPVAIAPDEPIDEALERVQRAMDETQDRADSCFGPPRA